MPSPRHRAALLVAALVVFAACVSQAASPPPSTPSPVVTPPPTPTPTLVPTPTPVPRIDVPLAVVTGFTNLKDAVTEAEVRAAMEADTIIQPCELFTAVNPVPRCLPAPEIATHLSANPLDLAMLPAGLVQPATKVLPVDGADLFGGAEARSLPYPFHTTVDASMGWAPYVRAEIRTVISPGNSCPDRGPAYAAITLGRGWDWVFGGGTAVYNGFNAPGGVSTVNVVPTGNEGAVAALMRSGDLTYAEQECPFVSNFRVNNGTVFTIDPAVIPLFRDTYGVDVMPFAANHPFDQGEAGFLESLDHIAAAGLPTTGAGRTLDEALTPAFFEDDGLTFAFVAHNGIPGPVPAAPDQPGVAWLTDENVFESVARARAGADVVFCVPQWWGGAEYHYDWRDPMRHQQAVYLEAGCDHVLGQGTHYSGPIDWTTDADGRLHLTVVSSGNFMFGQGWSQDTMEGVIFELTFRGAELVQVRMHPYVTLDQAQINLTDPEGDGHYVLDRIFEWSPEPPP
jgi:poly-gamma-glutamate capsule biosynthesis protein CapA/YwtB (metallophosphatase superfamily)